MKIGVLGGTFNPPHNAHLHLANIFIKGLSLDKLLFVPTKIPPHKQHTELASELDRFNMCRILTHDMEKIEVSDMEIASEGVSYTYKTLHMLKEIYPLSTLYFIMGSDMFFTVDSWKNHTVIFELAHICTAAREENEYRELIKKQKLLNAIGVQSTVLNNSIFPLSSTQIRGMIKKGENVDNLLPEKLVRYINEKKLYKGG